jgi:hypothetical protein
MCLSNPDAVAPILVTSNTPYWPKLGRLELKTTQGIIPTRDINNADYTNKFDAVVNAFNKLFHEKGKLATIWGGEEHEEVVPDRVFEGSSWAGSRPRVTGLLIETWIWQSTKGKMLHLDKT